MTMMQVLSLVLVDETRNREGSCSIEKKGRRRVVNERNMLMKIGAFCGEQSASDVDDHFCAGAAF